MPNIKTNAPTVLHLEMRAIPAAISQSVADVLKVHRIFLPPDVVREIGKNATQILFNLDENKANWTDEVVSVESPWRPSDGAFA
jgi:hypothetical protein